MELLPARDSMNKGPVHILVQVSGGHTPFLLGDYLEVEWPDRMGVERLTCTERGEGGVAGTRKLSRVTEAFNILRLVMVLWV